MEHILVPNEGGVVTAMIHNPVKNNFRVHDLSQGSQIINPSQPVVASQTVAPIAEAAEHGSESEDSDDPDYVAHTDDSGEDSEVVELRRHARKFKKRMKQSKSWIGRDASGPVPIELVANMEQQKAGEEEDWKYDSSDEDYSYEEVPMERWLASY